MMLVAASVAPLYSGTTGIISGTVTDSETGEKLVGVNVIVEGTDLTTVTDKNGYYVITNVPPGHYKVSASLVGYADLLVEQVSVIMDVTSKVDLGLVQGVAEEEEIIVAEARPMIQHDVIPTMYVVDHEQEQMVKDRPDYMYTTPRLMLTQPGVVADEYGYPHIRGGRGNQVGYLIDGIPATESLGNGFATNLVSVGAYKTEIYTGGYRPEYGNATSGAVNQITKTGRTAPGVSFETIGGSLAFTGAYPEIGGVTEKGFDYYVGAFLWRSELEGTDWNEADSSDVIGNFTYPVGAKDKLSMQMATGTAKYQMPYVHTVSYGPGGMEAIDPERDHQHQSHLLTALTLNHTISPSSFFTIRPYYLRSRAKMDALSDDGLGWWIDKESATTGLQFDYTNQISERHLLKAGAIRMASDNKYWANVPSYGNYEYTANTDTVQTGLYVQDQMRLGSRWGFEAGMRYDRMKYDKEVNEDTSESQWSPRFGLSYSIDPRTKLRCSYGKMIEFVYTQALERNYTDPMWELFYGFANSDPRPERSKEFDIGWDRQVSKDYLVQVTAFRRKFTDMLQARSLDPADPDGYPRIYENLGEGISKGIEVLVKKRPSGPWSGWLSYTLSKAKAQSSNDQATVIPGVFHYVDWDQRHTVMAVMNYINRGWTYSLAGEHGSGLPYSLAGEDPNTRRVASHVVFNLNISKEVKGGWLPRGTMSLGVANLFNTGAALDRAEDGEPTVRVAPRFAALSYTRHF